MKGQEPTILDDLLHTRLDLAFECLEKDTEYTILCDFQEENESKVSSIFKSIPPKDYEIVSRYLDAQMEREGLELVAAYKQGFQDGLQLFGKLTKLMA